MLLTGVKLTSQKNKKPCELAVRGLDALLDYQDYPVKAAYNATMNRRPLVLELLILAYWLAKNGTNYQDPDLELVDEICRSMEFYLIKASAELAQEQGACLKSDETKYSKG